MLWRIFTPHGNHLRFTAERKNRVVNFYKLLPRLIEARSKEWLNRKMAVLHQKDLEASRNINRLCDYK